MRGVLKTLGLLLLVLTLAAPQAFPSASAGGFVVRGTLDCGRSSGEACAVGPTLTLITDDLGERGGRAIIDITAILGLLGDLEQDDYLEIAVETLADGTLVATGLERDRDDDDTDDQTGNRRPRRDEPNVAPGATATITPTVTPTPTRTPTGTLLATVTAPPGGPTLTITPGGPTLTPTATITPGGPTLTPTATITPGGPTLTPTATITPGGPTLTPTSTPTATTTPTATATATVTGTPTNTPTATPTGTPTNTPTATATATVTNTPTDTPTAAATPVPPTAVADAATVAEDSGATALPVLANDTNPSAGPISITSVTQPTNGSAVITGGGTGLTYAPNANFCNSPPGTTLDTFTYTLTPGGSSATVSMTVTCVDDNPVAVSDAATVAEDSGSNPIPVLANDTDLDGGPISIASVTQPTNGTVVITGGGTGLTYAPNPDYCNTPPGTTLDTFTYTLTPGGSTATVTVTVTCVNDPPVAVNDQFDFVGNTDLVVDLAALGTPHVRADTGSTFGVLDNDSDPDQGSSLAISSITVGACMDITAPFDCSDPAIGRVQMQTNGRFIFTPAPGDSSATETFTYTVTDNGTPLPASTTATVTLTRFSRVWYVKNDAAGGGNGVSSAPFNTLATAQSVSVAGDTIYVFTGVGTTGQNSGITLKTNQRLLGEGVALTVQGTVNGVANPTLRAAGSRPTIGNPGGAGVTLENGTTVSGLNVDVSAGSGSGLLANGKNGITVSALNATSAGGAAINLTNTSANFTGPHTITSTTGTGFSATGGGTVTVTGSPNTISSTTGTALNVANSTIGASGLTFQSISSNGAANGIVLNTTGSSGGLTVTGTGAAGSGGTIQNKSIGLSLTSTRGASFSWMQLNDFGDYAVRGSSLDGFTLDNTVISGTNGDDPSADEGSVRLEELIGSASIANSSVSGTIETQVRVTNSSGTLNRLTVNNVTFGSMNDGPTGTGDNALLIESLGSAVINSTITNNIFTAARATHINRVLNGTHTSDTVITGNTISNTGVTTVSAGGAAIRIFGGNNSGFNASATFTIDSNTMRDSRGTALAVNKLGGSGTFSGTITNNTVGVAGVSNSGSSEGSGIFMLTDGAGSYTATVAGNSVHQYGNFGIFMQTGGSGTAGNGTMKATVTGNTVANPGTLVFAKNGFQLNNGVTAGDTYRTCLTLGGVGALANSISSTGTDGGTDFRLRQRQSTTVYLPGYSGANDDDAAVVTFAQGNNDPVSTPTGSAANTVPTGGGFSSTCPF